MKPCYEGKEFEALKLRYEDQVALLRKLTDLDLQIFGGFLTVFLGFGSWLSQHPPKSVWIKAGLLLIAFALSVATSLLLHYNYHRRKEAAMTVKALNKALGFNSMDAYLEGEKINSDTVFRPWRGVYLFSIVTIFIGICIITLNP